MHTFESLADVLSKPDPFPSQSEQQLTLEYAPRKDVIAIWKAAPSEYSMKRCLASDIPPQSLKCGKKIKRD